MIKKILLGLGGTPYTTVAIQRAVGIAKRFDAEITGVTVLDFKGLSHGGIALSGTLHAAKEIAAQGSPSRELVKGEGLRCFCAP